MKTVDYVEVPLFFQNRFKDISVLLKSIFMHAGTGCYWTPAYWCEMYWKLNEYCNKFSWIFQCILARVKTIRFCLTTELKAQNWNYSVKRPYSTSSNHSQRTRMNKKKTRTNLNLLTAYCRRSLFLVFQNFRWASTNSGDFYYEQPFLCWTLLNCNELQRPRRFSFCRESELVAVRRKIVTVWPRLH